MNKCYLPLICFLVFVCACKPDTSGDQKKLEAPKTVIHYMGWYSTANPGEDSLRHWKYGTANTPLLGYYDSQDKSVILCHLLWSWAANVDAVVVNVKDEYDRQTLLKVQEVVGELRALSGGNFDMETAISFDDQGFDLQEPLDTALFKIAQFQNENVHANDFYLNFNGKPIVFSFDYPHKFLTAETLRESLDEVFGEREALLVWNTFGEGENTEDFVDAFYPWVQPGGKWDEKGLNWGAPYLDYFYGQVNQFNKPTHQFVGGGVWPGFDDRNNISWGGNRLISRQEGSVYDSTWQYVVDYSGSLSMKYVMIETWNDWNEGTEIEPSKEHRYQYLLQTESNIAQLHGAEFVADSSKYELGLLIYQAAQNLSTSGDSAVFHTALKQFFDMNMKEVENTISKLL